MDLHEDIVIEILLHLPVQSLLRFRSVCKFWCNIIDSFAFRKNHHPHVHEDAALLLEFNQCSWLHGEYSMTDVDNGKSYKLGFPGLQEFLSGMSRLAVIGCVNGLICIHKNHNSDSAIAVCNPCLGEIKILPASPLMIANGSSWPQRCRIGFGFDYVSKEYKLVQLTFCSEIQSYVAEVYSPTTNTWRKIDIDVFDDGSLCLELATINNSAYEVSGIWAHWWTKRWINENFVDVILSFDMHNEVFKIRLLPDIPEILRVFAKDDNSFVVFVNKFYDNLLEVWEGRERCWTCIGNVELRSFGIPGALWKRNEVVIKDYGEDLFFYDYGKGERKSIEMPNIRRTRLSILEYMCSLISP